MTPPYPLVEFLARYMPYCITRLTDLTAYAVLNREYSPLGFPLDMSVYYEDFQVNSDIQGLTPEVARNMSVRGLDKTDRVYLYNGTCKPTHQPRHWKEYMRRLRLLADLPVSGTLADRPSFAARYLPHALVLQPSGEFRVLNCAGRPLGFPTSGEDDAAYYEPPTTSRMHGLTSHQIQHIALNPHQHQHLILFHERSFPTSSDANWSAYSDRLRRLARLGVMR